MKSKDRKKAILAAACRAAERHHYRNMTRDQVAECAEISGSLIYAHFKTMHSLRSAVLRHAVKHDMIEIIAQGLAMKDPITSRVTDDIKERAAAILFGV